VDHTLIPLYLTVPGKAFVVLGKTSRRKKQMLFDSFGFDYTHGCYKCTKDKPGTKHCPFYDLCYDTLGVDSSPTKEIEE